MRVIFTKNKTLISKLIRFFTWSKWHHCGILDNEYVIEASFSKGVVKTPIEDFLLKATEFEVGYLKGDITKAYQQIGKSYDLSAVIGIFFRNKSWENKDKWFCSELVAYCSSVFRNSKIPRITPEHIYMVSKIEDDNNNNKVN